MFISKSQLTPLLRISLFSVLAFSFLNACEIDDENDIDSGDASTAPVCNVEPQTCGTDLGMDLSFTVSGTTVGLPNDYGSSCISDADGGDVIFTWTAPQTGVYDISLRGSRYDTILTILDGGCSGAELACNDDISGSMLLSEIEQLPLEACQTIAIIIDGSATIEGEYTLTGSFVEGEFCGDGEDNDGDGLVDCDDTDCSPAVCLEMGEWPAEWAILEDEVLELTNQRRAAGATCGPYNGEPAIEYDPAGPLEADNFLRLSSRLHSEDMAKRNFFDHNTPEGVDPFERMENAGFTGDSPMGENIAAGQSSAEEVVQGWMDSPGHCRNMMEPGYNVLGVGYYYLQSNEYQRFWTQNFGGSHGEE